MIFREHLLQWYGVYGREFYWRTQTLTPFEVLVTEMLLKRTRAETVDRYGPAVLDQIRTPEDPLNMNKSDLIELLRPFGLYNRRSKNIRNVCRTLVGDFESSVPDTREELLGISGIGEYTADSVACVAFGCPILVMDVNVATVAEKFFNIEPAADLRQDKNIRPALEPLIPVNNPEKVNWALIDLGADINTAGNTAADYPLPEIN